VGQMTDIRQLKRELRARYRAIREGMEPARKLAADQAIFRRFTAGAFYQKAHTLLCFASTPIEVDTWPLLRQALTDGKRLALPTCLDARGTMDFFLVRSLDELRPGRFSLWEPSPERAPRLDSYRGSVCVLPAFAFDPEGYRIGFGKGYYDRFLQRYTGLKVGVCYNSCIAPSLPHGRYDAAADYLVTPKYTMTIRAGARGGSTE
jgi:5-formyltetrahydrofolate cyclo-ligase